MDKIKIDRSKYGPEVKYKKGLDELFDVLGSYDEGTAKTNPYKVLYEALTDHKAILELGSGWEKEAIEAQSLFGPDTNWVSLNPLLGIPDHNTKVKDHMDEHTWERHIRQGLSNHGIDMPARSAVSAESIALPFPGNSFDLVLASWSVPTVIEEQIKNASDDPEQQIRLTAELVSMLPETCKELSRILRKCGSSITFPIRDRRIVDWMIEELNKSGAWEHVVCTTPDSTSYVVEQDNPVNYLLMSVKQ